MRDRVVALVGRLGGEVRLDEQATGRPIVEVRLVTTRVADDQLGDLRGLSSLRTLDLTQTRISDAGLARLRGHEGLRSLLAYDTRVTDRGLEHIATMSGLEKLLVGSCDVSGPGLSHLASLKHLKALSLIELDLTDSGLAALANLARLEELDLVGLKITDAGLAHVRGLSRLRRLALDGNEITDAGLAHLVGLIDLEELSLKGTRVTDAGLIALTSLPHLRRLKHDDTKITAAGLDRLRHLDRTAATAVTDRPQAPEPGKDAGGVAKPDDATPDRIRAAVTKALPPLQKGLIVYAEKRDCFSCHNQAVPLVALEIARARGLAIDEEAFEGAMALTLADLEKRARAISQGARAARRGNPGGLRVVDARSRRESRRRGHRRGDGIPAEVRSRSRPLDRDLAASADRGERVHDHGPDAPGVAVLQHQEPDRRRERSGPPGPRWLAASRPVDTEDRVFRLWGLKYADASPAELEAAARDLLAAQRSDGGWAQTDKLASDAYATGSALVALHQAGRLATDDPAYRRGVAFLMRRRRPTAPGSLPPGATRSSSTSRAASPTARTSSSPWPRAAGPPRRWPWPCRRSHRARVRRASWKGEAPSEPCPTVRREARPRGMHQASACPGRVRLP